MLYAIFPLGGDNPQLPKDVEERFEVIYTQYAPRAWFVDFKGTTDELTELIWPEEFDEDAHPLPEGFVVRLHRYNGWANSDLWEWLGAHRRER